jgi:hypothetical protein
VAREIWRIPETIRENYQRVPLPIYEFVHADLKGIVGHLNTDPDRKEKVRLYDLAAVFLLDGVQLFDFSTI